MTVEVERSFDVETSIDEVWNLLADERKRAQVISFVETFDVRDDGVVWNLRVPIPLVDRTVAVKTQDIERDPPRFVKFVGQSKIMQVTGEHELTEIAGGTRVRSKFVVDGTVPGVETFFERNFDEELANIRRAVEDSVADVEEA